MMVGEQSMIRIEEIPVERIDEFWNIHIGYLVDDGIISDEEDIEYFSGDEYRGNGTGHKCFDALENYTRSDGAKYYEINSTKEDSIRFWKSNGFIENGKDEWDMPLFEKRGKDMDRA